MLELNLAPRRRRAFGWERDVRQRHLRRVLPHLRRQIGRPLGTVLADPVGAAVRVRVRARDSARVRVRVRVRARVRVRVRARLLSCD